MVAQQHASSVKRGPSVESFQAMHARRESFMVTVVGDWPRPSVRLMSGGMCRQRGQLAPPRWTI